MDEFLTWPERLVGTLANGCGLIFGEAKQPLCQFLKPLELGARRCGLVAHRLLLGAFAAPLAVSRSVFPVSILYVNRLPAVDASTWRKRLESEPSRSLNRNACSSRYRAK